MIENLPEQLWIADLLNYSFGATILSAMIVGALWLVLKPILYFWDRHDERKDKANGG